MSGHKIFVTKTAQKMVRKDCRKVGYISHFLTTDYAPPAYCLTFHEQCNLKNMNLYFAGNQGYEP